MSEAAILGELNADRAWQNIVEITERFPTRLAGSENSARAAEYIAEQLRAAGVEAELIRFLGLVSFPEGARVEVRAPERYAIEATALGHSVPTEGIEGELVYVGSGGEEEIAGVDLRGKITLSELSYAPPRQEKQRLHGQAGAIGAVMMNWGHDENTAIPFGSVKPVWGNPTPDNYATEMVTIPCAGIARVDGLKLKRLCQKHGPVRVWLQVDCRNEWRDCVEVVGRLPGKDPEGHYAIVGGHMDSWFGPQATDNAAGNACTLELARAFATHRDLLHRGILFGFWMGHETGTMVGSSYFVDTHWDELRARAVGYLQIDQPAMAGTSQWEAASNAELRRFHQAVERRVIPDIPAHWARMIKVGDSSFFGIGVPMIAAEAGFTEAEIARTARATLGWWHHSIHNTIDKLDKEMLAKSLRCYAAYMWGFCQEPVLPYEFVTVASQFEERLSELQAKAPGHVDLETPLRRARELGEAAARLDEVAQSLRDRQGAERQRALVNGVLMRLSRILVPLASTAAGAYGHDPYGLSAQRQMIPSLVPLLKLATLQRGTPEYQMLWTKVVRDRNRVADGLLDARRVVEVALALVG